MQKTEEFDIKGLKILIALPSHDGKVVVEYLAGIIELLSEIPKYGATVEVIYLKGNSLVQVARNSLVEGFLERGHDKLVFIDSDIGFRGKDLIRLLAFSTKYPLVGGMYQTKNKEGLFKATLSSDEKGKAVFNEYGLIKMTAMPLGFSVIDKSVFDTLLPLQQKFWHNKKEIPEFFKVYVENGQVWGEDIEFCEQWLHVGGEVWCDPTIHLQHIGDYAYEGSFINALKEQGVLNDSDV